MNLLSDLWSKITDLSLPIKCYVDLIQNISKYLVLHEKTEAITALARHAYHKLESLVFASPDVLDQMKYDSRERQMRLFVYKQASRSMLLVFLRIGISDDVHQFRSQLHRYLSSEEIEQIWHDVGQDLIVDSRTLLNSTAYTTWILLHTL